MTIMSSSSAGRKSGSYFNHRGIWTMTSRGLPEMSSRRYCSLTVGSAGAAADDIRNRGTDATFIGFCELELEALPSVSRFFSREVFPDS
jgi:hypothetical protein